MAESTEIALNREQQLELYYFLRLTRSLEEQLARLFRQNQIVGGLYLSLGQEAISVGTAYALGPGDWIAPMIRNVGALLVRGYKPRGILTQYMARYTSPTFGKDTTSHFGDLHVRHVVSPISMLGDLIPVMTGVAMGARYIGQKTVAMTWIGDGGTSTGAFHEGLNLAAVQKAPLVLVVENNQWAYSTPVARQVPLVDLADRARAYGIASVVVDGNDVVAVYGAAKVAIEHARSGGGPVLIEAKTMRMCGHAQHDAAEYVPKEMLEQWKARDPVARFERHLTEQGLWDKRTKEALDARVQREIAEDLAFAESSPFPPPELAEQGVYCEGCHEIAPVWQRPVEELLPPKSSVRAEWPSFAEAAEGRPGNARMPALAEGQTARAAASGNGARRGRAKAAAKRKSARRPARPKARR